jgi:hypothetical protein
MNKLKLVLVSVILCFSMQSRADLFGADVAVLSQILAQTIAQLEQLKLILKDGQDSLNLMRDVNAGIFDTLQVLESMAQHTDPGLYGDLKNVEEVARKVRELYGIATDSPLKNSQITTDQTIAEAIEFNNDTYKYSKDLDVIGEQIKAFADQASPGRAQKLTAQSLGVVIHVMNQQLRAQATGLKLQAQALAVQNKRSKEETTEYLSQTKVIGDSLGQYNFQPRLPRF